MTTSDTSDTSDTRDTLDHVTPPAPSSANRPPAQPRLERFVEVLVVAAACTLETLPLFCWLLVLAAYQTDDPDMVAAPFWWMWLLVFGTRWLGALFTGGPDTTPQRRRTNVWLLTASIATLAPATLVATFWLSPSTRDFLATGQDTTGPVGLTLLVGWLWWRGLLLGRGRVTRERMYVRFVASLAVMITALAGAAAIQGVARALTASYLILLLALLLFAGLMGLTLAQARDTSFEMRSAFRGNQPMALPPVFTRSWLAASLALSCGVSWLALLLAALISGQSVRLLAVAMGNVVNGLLSAIQLIFTPLFLLFAWIVNKPVEWLFTLLHNYGGYQPITPPQPPHICATPGTTPGATPVASPIGSPAGTPASGGFASSPACSGSASSAPSLVPAEWLTAIRWVVVVLAIVAALLLLARLLRRYTESRRERAFTEVRTMLDAREILGGQLRRFLDAFRRRTQPEPAPASDDLTEGSVRRVYRDTLTAAATRGRARRASETPHEYQRRITRDDGPLPAPSPEVADALTTLTHAYEQARYGEDTADTATPATPEAVSAADTVRRWLAHPDGEQ
jgi:hypothetical protein